MSSSAQTIAPDASAPGRAEPETETDTAAQLRSLFAAQRAAFAAEPYPEPHVRRDRLDRLEGAVLDHRHQIETAVAADFGGRPVQVTRLVDVMQTVLAIRDARRHLGRWMQARRLPTALHFLPARNRLMRQPLGVIGIVAPWNYPLNLAIAPAAAALAAGNRVMIKPSELTPRLAELMARMVADSFDADEMTVVTGDAETGRAFVALPFDHLLFTGSTKVGRMVAEAAARNLTPVTLELGGKSPAIIDPSADLAVAAPRIVHGKLFNAGQTCIAPDYLLVPEGRCGAVIEALKAAFAAQFPAGAGFTDATGIVSDGHFARLQALLADASAKGARLVPLVDLPERPNAAPARFVPPTLVLDANDTMRVMQEEIFGPILPILTYTSLDAALARINAGDRPLALYWFGTDAGRRDQVLRHTVSGGVTINDTMLHFAQEAAPFGGVGPSGQGAYHGEWGFRTFSHEKTIHIQPRLSGMRLLYPPYGRMFDRVVSLVMRIG